jgi:hypothetical protein
MMTPLHRRRITHLDDLLSQAISYQPSAVSHFVLADG